MLNMDRGTRRLVAAGAIACALAAGAYTTLRVTFGGRPVYIHVRWAPSVDDAARQRLEQTLGLIEGEPREGRTWGYTLTAPSRANIQTLVQHPAVEDTHNLNRSTFRPARYFVGLLSVLLFAAAMEEISWGQRALQIESPQFFIENSDQREINVHNVLQQALAIRTKHVVGIAFLLYGVAFPWLMRPGRLTLERLGRYVVVPPLFLSPAILISVLFMATPDGQRGGNRGVSAQPVPVCIRGVPVVPGTTFLSIEWARAASRISASLSLTGHALDAGKFSGESVVLSFRAAARPSSRCGRRSRPTSSPRVARTYRGRG
jgi:hypothetical protein